MVARRRLDRLPLSHDAAAAERELLGTRSFVAQNHTVTLEPTCESFEALARGRNPHGFGTYLALDNAPGCGARAFPDGPPQPR